MHDDLNAMFDSLRRVAGERPLAPVATIHRAGRRRRTLRRNLVVAACVTAVLAVVGTIAVLGKGNVPTPPDPADSSPPTPVLSSPPSGNACAPQDFDPRPWYAGEGAAGTAVQTAILRVRPDGRACVLQGPPALEGMPESGTAITALPLRFEGGPQQLPLSPGDYVKFSILTSTDPDCPGGRKGYTRVSIVMGDNRYQLKAFDPDVGCVQSNLELWERAAVPNETNYATLTRAPE